jgi:hypothetical protein
MRTLSDEKRRSFCMCMAFTFNDMYGLCNGCMGFISGIDE